MESSLMDVTCLNPWTHLVHPSGEEPTENLLLVIGRALFWSNSDGPTSVVWQLQLSVQSGKVSLQLLSERVEVFLNTWEKKKQVCLHVKNLICMLSDLILG